MKIAIASGKGGTGKTTLAVNLALRAAETQATLLIDLDVEEPNSGLFLSGSPQREERRYRQVPFWDKASCTLCGKCTEVCHYNAVLKLGDRIMVLPELCHSCYACSELCPTKALPMQDSELGWLRVYRQGGLSFIESKLDIGVEMASPLINQTLAYAAENYPDAGLQLRDCPPGTSCSVINATKDADLVILVTEPTPFGLHDLSLAVNTMRHLKKPLAVVINRVGIGNDDVFKYCETQGIPIWAAFKHQREIAEIYSRGEIIYTQVPEFRDELDKILKEISIARHP
ncbi:MAG: ATP-binding protein [Candidatus Cloacimonetes bacterium]|nr:ATP-binding protein [Candidatus Cloacimonadota bacterium]